MAKSKRTLFKTKDVNQIPKLTKYQVYEGLSYKEAEKLFVEKHGEKPTLGILLLRDYLRENYSDQWWLAIPDQEIQLPLMEEPREDN